MHTLDASFRDLTFSWMQIKQTTGSLYFWAAHLAGPRWGPFASWCCAWLETIGLVAGIGTQVVFCSVDSHL
jgi:amino acid transporter